MKTTNAYGQYIVLKIPTGGYVSAQDTGIIVDGKHPFSIETWIYLNGMGNDISLLKKQDVFNIGVSHGKLFFQYGNVEIYQLSSQVKISSGMWHHIAVTYDKSSLFFYINGEIVGKVATSISITENKFANLIGSNLDGYIRYLKTYDSCLDSDDVKDSMFFSSPKETSPCAHFDFATNPPIDRCHPSSTLELSNGCYSCLCEPSLFLQSTAYAQPSLSEHINPGGRQIDSYTIQVSVFITGNQSRQTIFVNGNHDLDAGIAMYLRYESEQKGYRLCSLRGADTNRENKLFSTAIIPTDEWVNLAVSYDGQSSRIYINGELDAQEDNVGPIILPMTKGNILIGGMLEGDMPIGLNTMQGYIRRVDIWSRALDKDEIKLFADDCPDIDAEGLVDYFDFTNEPFRSARLDIPVSLNDLACFQERISIVSEHISEPLFARYKTVKANPIMVLHEREKLDIMSLEKQVLSLCSLEKIGTIENISRIVGRDVSEIEMKRMATILERLNENKRDILLAVTHHLEGTDFVLVAHYSSGSEAIARCRIDEIDDCTLRIIELIFIIIGGAISALFGIKTTLSQKAIEFIRLEILTLPAISAIISKGMTLTSSDVYDCVHTLHTHGKLKALLRLIVDLGFWSLVRFLAKVVLTFMGIGWADTIASLVSTAVTFTLRFVEYVKSCVPPPSVTLESISFNHDKTRCDISALNLRQNNQNVISCPEWENGGRVNKPVAYAVNRMNNVVIKAQFRMSYISPLSISVRAIAAAGNPLGDLSTETVILFPGLSRELSFTINGVTANLPIGCIQNLQWNWEYQDPASGNWNRITASSHKVYFLLDVPSIPWDQNAQDSSRWPWSDFLDVSSNWLPANGVLRNANLASLFTSGINHSGMKYSGMPQYLCSDGSFFLNDFLINYNRNPQQTFIECSECASLVKLSTSIWGFGNISMVYFNNNINGCSCVNTSYLQGIGSQQWETHQWRYHAIAKEGSSSVNPNDSVYDACIHLDISTDPWDILPYPVYDPVIPGGDHAMVLGQLTQTTMTVPYTTNNEYFNRLFDYQSTNRTPLTINSFAITNIL